MNAGADSNRGHMSASTRLFIVTCLSVAVPCAAQSQSLDPASVVRRVDNHEDRASSVTLSDGTVFPTMLHEVRVLAALRTHRKRPFLILSGRGCMDCDAGISIYVHSPSDGPMQNEGSQPRHSFPGKVVDRETGALVFRSRFFVGECLASFSEVAVWFSEARAESGEWVQEVFVIDVGPDDVLRQHRIQAAMPAVEETERRVRAGSCMEVPGVDATTEP
ncbi:MAG: hypothetical protein IT357_04145 [Gemmatimonadaceae bacterium]|nr:hypothetical protein [Gemmatimonadaceae bacterium]